MEFTLFPNSKEVDFNALFSKYYASLCIYARRYIEDVDICQNLVSDVFANLWEKRDEVDYNSVTIVGYMKNSVRNACFNYLRNMKHHWSYEKSVEVATPVYADSPEAIYVLNELLDLFNVTLRKLPENQRISFLKELLEDKSQKDIASELNVSSKSIRRYKAKTIEIFRNILKDYIS